MRRRYPAIDWFRLIAALLVVANHTSPLLSFNETADFVLARVIARLAVPFFLMVSGYFVFSRYARRGDILNGQNGREGSGPFLRFLRSTAILYAVAILLYLPLTINNGYLTEGNLLVNVLKALFFNGTLYHLWYMPAAILGGLIVWLLLKVCKPGVVLGITAALYIIGMFGDSYYGVAQGIPLLKTAYDGMFTVFDYTRNGIFLAPVFIALGATLNPTGIEEGERKRIPALIGFLICLGGMTAEGLLLHANGLQRHDSMYILLLPCVFFLFRFLLTFEGRAPMLLAPLSMALYIIHPWVIVLVRGGAKAVGATGLLVDNSLVHYLLVCIISVVIAWLYAFIANKIKGKRRLANSPSRLSAPEAETPPEEFRHAPPERREPEWNTQPAEEPGSKWTYRP